MITLLLCTFLFFSANSQQWFVNSHFTSSSCLGNPFWEVAAKGGTSCTPAFCALTFSSPSDYTTVKCTGTGPETTITDGLIARSYSKGQSCSSASLYNVATYRTNACNSLPGGSFKVLCSDTVAVRMNYGDSTCTTPTTNVTLVTGARNTCLTAASGSADIIWSCDAAFSRAGLMGILLLVLMVAVSA